MDPLTVFMASLFGSMIAQALRSRAEFRDYYPKSAAGELQPYLGWTEMVGGGVRWQVEPGSAVWIESRYLRPISGNIFDEHKLGAVGKAVKQARRKELPMIAMMAGYGQVHRLDPEWIAESQAYRDDNLGDPFTTGDRQLDEWLVRRYNRENDDEEENQEMEELLAKAVASSQGDLGKWTATVRDGNHRTFGAVLGGEERVAVRLYDNDEQELRELCKKGFGDRRSLERRDLLFKAISDTGAIPHWLDEETAARLELLPSMETGSRKLLPGVSNLTKNSPPHLLQKYMRGKCFVLAWVLNKDYKAPIYGLFDGADLHHAFVFSPDGFAVDIRGRTPLSAVSSGFENREWSIKPITAKQCIDASRYVPTVKDRAEARQVAITYRLGEVLQALKSNQGLNNEG